MSRGHRPVLLVLSALLICTAPATAHAAVTAHGSVGQAYVLGAKKDQRLQLLDRRGQVAESGRADRLGSFIFRQLPARSGYRVRYGAKVTKPFAVLRGRDHPKASFYKQQTLKQGLNYVTMRDGVELAMTVRLPAGKKLSDGPFPTLIEHSGYQIAAPGDLLSSVTASLGGGSPKPDPLVPAAGTAVGSLIAPLLDFAVVSVQMRGSGCSGGAFDLFDLPTTYDGYDMVEAVAAQSWVKGGKVGLAGISFSGITQLFAAGTQPPHLAAITPMSVTDDTYQGTGFPGGIVNSGFATSWIKDRMDEAEPAPGGGQPWAKELVKRGDKHCKANQALRLQTEDALEVQKQHPYRTPSIYEQRAGATWMSRIKVPVFLVGQFQDEQTGGHFAESLGRLSGNRKVWLSLQNGVHADSLGPATLTRWVEFLNLYVADRIPRIPDGVLALSGALYDYLANAAALPVQQSRFAGTTDVAAARATFERDPRVRLLMDNGGTALGPGSIGPAWELNYDAWPIRQVRPTSYYLGAGGALTPAVPTQAGTVGYTGDPKARPKKTLPGSGEADAWKAQPPYAWRPVAAGKGLGWVTQPLAVDTVIAGPSSLDLRLRSSARDTDLQVTLSEVRPDGQETYVQNGWLRASHRKLDAKRSTALDPVPTHLPQDAEALPSGEFTTVRVPVFPVAHAFRAGSRIRVTVQAPGGDRPRWDFATIEKGTTRNSISLGGTTPTRLVLPVITGANALGTPLPGPTALRGQPSRAYAAAANGG